MKADFFSSLIYILVIILIIPGTISSMASAIDQDPGNDGSDTAGPNLNEENPRDGTSNEESPNEENPNEENPNEENPNEENPNEENPNEENPNEESPNEENPNEENPNEENPNEESPNEESPNEENPNEENPNEESPNEENPNERSPNKKSPNERSPNKKSPNKQNPNTKNPNTVTLDNRENKEDNNSNSSSDSSSPTNNSSSSGSSSSSGWGMNLVSSEDASNIAAKELATRSVISGYPVKFDFVEGVTCVTYIKFDPKKTFRRTTTVVEELKNKSTLVPTTPQGKVYKHVNVWVGDKGAGLPTSIRNGLIEFKVEKSWIKDENINETLITLQRYDEDWQPLYTEKVREDKNYVYFEAETPGYSFFAITEYEGSGEIQGANKIPLRSIGSEGRAAMSGNAGGDSRIKDPMGAARIFMAISLPLFMIIAGYCVLKKKI